MPVSDGFRTILRTPKTWFVVYSMNHLLGVRYEPEDDMVFDGYGDAGAGNLTRAVSSVLRKCDLARTSRKTTTDVVKVDALHCYDVDPRQD
jgi:hypothetical protein